MCTPVSTSRPLGEGATAPSATQENPGDVAPTRRKRWLAGLGIFLLVWGARLAVIDQYGSDVPTWDQWPVEGTALILPYEQGRLTWESFFRAHNEHRILFTRALAFALFAVNRQWDARLECVVNAMLPAAVAVGAFFWGRTLVPRKWHIGWLLIVVTTLALPMAWDNVVAGFHSQQHFLLGFSLVGIVLLHGRSGSALWCAGILCVVCALFAMGSGLLAAAAVAGTALLSMHSLALARTQAATLIVCSVVAAAGLILQAPAAAISELQAHSIGEFLRAFQRFLVWPIDRFAAGAGSAVLAALQWTPWLWLGWRVVRQGRRDDAQARAVFAIGLWVLLQIAASAYARGAGAPKLPSRYVDTVVLGLGVNCLALMLLLSSIAITGWGRRTLFGGATVATGLAMAGIAVQVTFHFLYRLPEHRELVTAYETTIRSYLASGDPSILVAPNIPCPDASTLIEVLSHPEIRAILPASVQPFSHDRGPLSRVAWHLTRFAPFVALLGLVGIIAAFSPGIGRKPRPRTDHALSAP